MEADPEGLDKNQTVNHENAGWQKPKFLAEETKHHVRYQRAVVDMEEYQQIISLSLMGLQDLSQKFSSESSWAQNVRFSAPSCLNEPDSWSRPPSASGYVLVLLGTLWKTMKSSLRSANEFEVKFSKFHSTDAKPQRSRFAARKKKNVKGEL